MSATCSSDRVSVHFCRSVVELHVTRQMLVEGVKRERDGRREHKKGREARHGRISAAFNHAILWLVWVWVSIFQSQEVGSPRWTLVISSHRNGRLVCHWPLCLSLRTGWNRVHLRTVFLSWGTWGQNQLFHTHTYTNQISSSSCSSFLQILLMTKARGFPGIFIWPECVLSPSYHSPPNTSFFKSMATFLRRWQWCLCMAVPVIYDARAVGPTVQMARISHANLSSSRWVSPMLCARLQTSLCLRRSEVNSL